MTCNVDFVQVFALSNDQNLQKLCQKYTLLGSTFLRGQGEDALLALGLVSGLVSPSTASNLVEF